MENNKREEPHTEWLHETDHDTLVLYLPGYKKEELKVQVTTTGKVRISGKRLVGENEFIQFVQEFPVPANCDADRIGASFKGGILNIKFPKFTPSEAEKPKPQPSQQPPKSEEHEMPAKETKKLEEKPKIGEEKTSNMGKNNDGNEGKVVAGEMNYGKIPDVKQAFDGLVKEVRSPRRVWNLVVALFMVWVLLVYVRRGYLFLFGGFGSEN